MKLIPLGGKFGIGKHTQVSDEDFEYLNSFKWTAAKRKNTLYVLRSAKDGDLVRIYLMHREVLGLKHGDKTMADHINHDGLNNQRDNLRTCNKSQNAINSILRINTTSKYRGVHFSKARNKWGASIGVKGKVIPIGKFKTEENAAIAYNIYAEKYHGEFANYNTANI